MNLLGDPIFSHHSVTQGRKISSSLFSFYVSDMSDSINGIDNQDFLNLISLLQLADDAVILADSFDSLKKRIYCTF